MFSRMTPMARVPVDLSKLLHWVCTSYSARAREIGVTTEGEIPPDVLVLGDAGGLEQVFGNLVKNALDAMEETGGQLIRRIEVGDERVHVHIEDTGPGFPPDVLPRVFDPFFTTKRVGKGTGLGLAISYGILQELGGEITARNREGGGAWFTVTLPAASRTSTSATYPMLSEEGALS